ncbi:hypothetical protein [Haloarchaeobius sp. DFWS5]|uniref:hypothetical protein n=1 Tax=Haloarchaeobius sp. DFWS5 TaxID=3446114 RepID=UPI003EBF2B57
MNAHITTRRTARKTIPTILVRGTLAVFGLLVLLTALVSLAAVVPGVGLLLALLAWTVLLGGVVALPFAVVRLVADAV